MRRCVCMVLAALLCLGLMTVGVQAEGYACGACVVGAVGQEGALLGQQEELLQPVAGLSKLPAILTLCRAFDEGIIAGDKVMSVSRRAAGISGPTAFLEAGESIQAEALLKAAVMISAGDAICTLGENAFGSESVFCQNIAVTCGELGVEKTFEDCVGTGVKFTATELLLLGLGSAESPTFCRWAGVYMDEITHEGGRTTELVSANRMLRSYSGCFGLLTGSSPEDGYCGVIAAKQKGITAVAVVIGARNSHTRFDIAKELLDSVYANYRLVTLTRAGEAVEEEVAVLDGEKKLVALVAGEGAEFLLPKGEEAPEKVLEVELPLQAPLYRDTPVGAVTYLLGEEVLCTLPLYPGEDVEAFTFLSLLKRFMGAYVRLAAQYGGAAGSQGEPYGIRQGKALPYAIETAKPFPPPPP